MVLSFRDNGILKGEPQGEPVAASTEAARRLGSGGMVNVSELLIGAVMKVGPKVLTGPGQKARKSVGRMRLRPRKH